MNLHTSYLQLSAKTLLGKAADNMACTDKVGYLHACMGTRWGDFWGVRNDAHVLFGCILCMSGHRVVCMHIQDHVYEFSIPTTRTA